MTSTPKGVGPAEYREDAPKGIGKGPAEYAETGPYHCEDCKYLKGRAAGHIVRYADGTGRCNQEVMVKSPEYAHDDSRLGGLAIVNIERGCCRFVDNIGLPETKSLEVRKMEKRYLVIPGAELRAEADYVISGTAITYNKPSPDDQLGPGAREQIAPGCFAASIRAGGWEGDVLCTINHSQDRLLGRLSNGTLKLMDGPTALRFSVQCDKNSQTARDAWASVKRGDLSQCSFAFADPEDTLIDDTDSKGNPCVTRVIRKAALIDVSVVVRPFYSAPGSTSAEARDAAARKSAADGAWRIEILRKAARLASNGLAAEQIQDSVGDEWALIRAHMEVAHGALEHAFATSDTARSILDNMGWSGDGDDDDVEEDSRSLKNTFRSFREAYAAAHAAMDAMCKSYAAVRLQHGAVKGRPRKRK